MILILAADSADSSGAITSLAYSSIQKNAPSFIVSPICCGEITILQPDQSVFQIITRPFFTEESRDLYSLAKCSKLFAKVLHKNMRDRNFAAVRCFGVISAGLKFHPHPEQACERALNCFYKPPLAPPWQGENNRAKLVIWIWWWFCGTEVPPAQESACEWGLGCFYKLRPTQACERVFGCVYKPTPSARTRLVV